MRRKIINSQLCNLSTYEMYKREFISLAENVFIFRNIPKFIDMAYINKKLLRSGAVAFFYEEVLDTIVALPFINIGNLDLYGRPKVIEVIGQNGYSRILKSQEFVIMYDNNSRLPIWIDILQYAERYAMITRTIDINIVQQRTPRVWKVPSGQEKTFRDMINNVDALVENVTTYSSVSIDDVTCILEPAPYVADKLEDSKNKIYAEFLRLVGIANLQEQKKERMIKDEMMATLGGTVASRYNRFEPRKKAVDEINEKFKNYLEKPIEVYYYDGVPSTEENVNDDINDNPESEVDFDAS
jgi:hypothetical protein